MFLVVGTWNLAISYGDSFYRVHRTLALNELLGCSHALFDK